MLGPKHNASGVGSFNLLLIKKKKCLNTILVFVLSISVYFGPCTFNFGSVWSLYFKK